MHKRNCILLVDDNKFTNIFNRRFLTKIEAAGHIFAVQDGKEALDYLMHEGKYEGADKEECPPPDLILLDINMPIMDGWEFLREFKKVKSFFNNTVIVMLTTSPNPDDETKARSIIEVDGYYRKPITREMMDEIHRQHFA